MTEDNPFLLMPYRVYIDTSVIGGCFDEKFSLWSNRLMTDIAHKRIIGRIAWLGEGFRSPLEWTCSISPCFSYGRGDGHSASLSAQ